MCLSPQTQTQSKLSGLASATKQRARDVWSRRKPGSDLDTTMKPVREMDMDSPTIPGRPALASQSQKDNGNNKWRQNVFGEAMLSSIEPPTSIAQVVGDQTPVDSGSEGFSPLTLTYSPITPESKEEARPKVPPKSRSDSKALQRKRSVTMIQTQTVSIVSSLRPREITIPTKKSSNEEVPLKRQRTRRRKSSNATDAPLPYGLRPSEAGIDLSKNELDILQHAAKVQAENYDVLKPSDVSFLQKELVQLESRCQYLKETQKSLRAGRKTLQSRMLTYLRSSRSGVFSRESLLKQEEALAELDDAIEDWDLKVETAENRRLQVSRKLLEHAAAALSVPNDHVLPLRLMATPPGTPERAKRIRTEVESITVYALLADVEQELGRFVLIPNNNLENIVLTFV
ncbi:Up-regulated during septation-domain-containing protein [Peziza echinospora]|nr:Up-regulated during septation-domain-containing protein [Peziza echinospora]